jgi:type VI protein secretion system component VasK
MKSQSGRALLAIKVVVLIAVVLLAISLWLNAQKQGWLNSKPPASASSPPTATLEQTHLQAQFKDALASYRKVIVLLAHDSALPAREQDVAN